MARLACSLVFILLVIAQCQCLELSKKNGGEGKQTWGYVQVREGASMFYWLYYSTAPGDYTTRPLVLWLQGGPGASSSGFGNFEEIGPLNTDLKFRKETWINETNVLFVDNPVGTGFSYVTDVKLLAKNNTQITLDLVEFMGRFLDKVPEFQSVPLYIFSESYGGKMAAQFALRLYKHIQKGKIKCNLKAVNLGDSWISPIDSVLTWAPFLYSTSLVDNTGFALVNNSAFLVEAALEAGHYRKATELWDKTEGVIDKVTNGVNVYNILETDTDSKTSSSLYSSSSSVPLSRRQLRRFHSDPLSQLMNGRIKTQLGIIPANVTWGGQSAAVFDALSEDFMKPVISIVNSLVNNTSVQVNVYSGQLDLIVDTMGTIRWVDKLSWSGMTGWRSAPRTPIILNNSTHMFVKRFKNFGFYWVLKAGHMVPQDAPTSALEMLKLITGLKPFPHA